MSRRIEERLLVGGNTSHSYEIRGLTVGATECRNPENPEGTLSLWIEYDSEDPLIELRTFQVYRTGEFVPEHAMYVDTVVIQHSGAVYHVFDVTGS